MSNDDVSDHSRGIALALCTVLGVFGGHRFYVGRWGSAICQLGTLGGLGMWWLYDMILVAAGGFRDSEGKLVSNWAEPGHRLTQPSGRPKSLPRQEEVMEEIYQLRDELSELNERMDFMERLLAQTKDRDRLPT